MDRHRVAAFPNPASSRARVRIRSRVSGLAENLELHPRDAGAHSKRRGGARRKIDNSALNMRTAIIDPDPHRFAVVELGDPDLGAQRQGPVRRGQTAAVVALSARRTFAVEMLAVYRRQARLRRRQRRAAGKVRDRAATGGCQPDTYARNRRRMLKTHGRRSHYSPSIARRASTPRMAIVGHSPTANVMRRRFLVPRPRATLERL